MAKPFQPGVVSANDLVTGAVIYLTGDGRWVGRPEEAELITDPVRAEARLWLADQQPEIAVGAYLAPAAPGPAGPRPAHLRETFRATGPSAAARLVRQEARDA